MSIKTTPAIERGIEALRNADDCGLDDWVVVRNILAAALDVGAVADEMARKSADYLWSAEHRELLVDIANDATRADAIIKESQQGFIDRHRKAVAEIRIALLGADS